MWKWLHPYANPETTYHLTGRVKPWFSWASVILLIIGFVWALLFVPADYQQGDSFRIFYMHVPTASMSYGIYITMAVAAFSSLVWQLKIADATVVALAPIGAVYTAIALITGAAWGKPMWGTWWVWDARLTSELVLLFLYLGIIALHNAFDDKQLAGKAANIMTLVGIINVPIIIYSVQWWNTLHQGSTVSNLGKPAMPIEMVWPLLFCFSGLAFFAATITCTRFQTELLARNRMRPWVRNLVQEENT